MLVRRTCPSGMEVMVAVQSGTVRSRVSHSSRTSETSESEFRPLLENCSGAGAPRHDQRKGFYVDTVVDSRYLEMDVVRESEGSLNGSEVENGAMRNGMCRKFLSSGAALENCRRSLEGEVQEVSEGVQFEMLSKCRIFVSVASRQYFLTIELELELIQTQMTQKPMLRAEVYARALRASQNRKEDSS